MYCITQFGTIGTLFCAPDGERLDSFETRRADKKLWNKIDYKNCASRWSLTNCNVMRGTHSVKSQVWFSSDTFITVAHEENLIYCLDFKF